MARLTDNGVPRHRHFVLQHLRSYMSESPTIQGWCPSSWQPMQAADGWVVRVRPPLARMHATQVLALAHLAQRYGSPQLELSRRGNWQLRGIQEADFPHVLAALIRADLASPQAQTDALPAILCTPWYQPEDATHQLAQALEAAITAAPMLAGLPSKFGFAVDDAMGSLRETPADIRLWHDGERYCLHPDGLRINNQPAGLTSANLNTIVQQAIALAHWFLDAHQKTSHPRTLHACPLEDNSDAINKHTDVPQAQQPPPKNHTQRAYRMRHAASQLLTEPIWQPAWQPLTHVPVEKRAAVASPARIPETGVLPGFLAGWGQLIAAPLGRIDAEALIQLAHWMQAHQPHTALHITPWRMLLLPLSQPLTPANWQASGLQQHQHWVTQADDARLRVFACSGQPQCPQALAPTQTLALKLADNVPPGWQLHVSGCAKACAQPAHPTRTLTLMAMPQASDADTANAANVVPSAHFLVQAPATVTPVVTSIHSEPITLSAQALCQQPETLFNFLT